MKIFDIFLVIFIYMNILFLTAIILKNNSIVDVGWGLGFLIIVLITLPWGNITWLKLIPNILVGFWGIRLSSHIFSRNFKKPEDFRYNAWRQEWGKSFYIRSYLQIFMLQGFLMLVISMPIIFYNNSDSKLSLIYILGILLWLIGFIFESVADYQLKQFIANRSPSKKIMTEGLWKYSRHPNYFGESLMWIAIFMITFNFSYAGYTFISPLLITFLLLYVSGVPMLENKYKGNSEYMAYSRRTNKFVPWYRKGGK